jgi:hypothetical protein
LAGLTRAEEKPAPPKPTILRAEVSRVEGSSLTVTVRSDKGERTETFTVGADTKVRLETADDETVKIKGEGGEREVTRPKTVEGKLADLKPGQRVSVTCTSDKKVTEVLGHRPPKKKEGEGK